MLPYWACAAPAGLSILIQTWQLLVAFAFPLHRRADRSAGTPPHAPPVSLLKPIRGHDPHLRDCLASWLRQEYPGPVECLFVVGTAEDPACAVVRSLLAEHPRAVARLVIDPGPPGANSKVCKLAAAAAMARHGHLVVSDADVAVPPWFLSELLAPLADPGVGLVNCFYRLANPATPALRCEAVAVNADFWSQVLQSRTLQPQDFALGAVMALRRAELEAAGGFGALANHLADDYQLGRRIHALGRRIELLPVPVDCWDPAAGWGAVWTHQLRWSRTIRVCRPGPFFASIVSNGTIWAGAWLAAALGTGAPAWPALLLLVLRAVMAQALYARMCRGLGRWIAPWWVWIKDVQAAVLWAAAFLGDRVVWRGDRFRVGRDGRLTRV